ncbi:hypothetical protein Bbelb_243230 [Branchiostoma belcheri]|nr:hypothetical protein Bbelb_243230 [Branchiostoma belcheri]
MLWVPATRCSECGYPNDFDDGKTKQYPIRPKSARQLQNLQERFASTQLLFSFAVLDPSLMPKPMPEKYGRAEVQCLVAHYGDEVEEIVHPEALDDEWLSLRQYIGQTNNLSQERLVRSLLADATLGRLYPNMRLLALVLMVIPVSTADTQRSFSTLKRIKTRLRSRL